MFSDDDIILAALIVEHGTSMGMVVGSSPAHTELASTVVRSYYRFRSCSPNDVKQMVF